MAEQALPKFSKSGELIQPEKPDGLYKKLLSLQSEVGAIVKDKDNPYFKSKYADINLMIEAVKPVLTKYGLVLLQPLANIAGTPAIKTILIDSETGERVEDITPINYTPRNPQEHGSAITYFRRYALQSMLFLEAKDDDGNTASDKTEDVEQVPFTDDEVPPMPVKQYNTDPIDGPDHEKETCPKCHIGVLVQKKGKFGPFIACNQYPKCRYIKK